jgi:hypothetical protein
MYATAPLRNSDRRKLKQQVIDAYGLSAEDGETLVPDGLQTAKFSTHLDEPGVRGRLRCYPLINSEHSRVILGVVYFKGWRSTVVHAPPGCGTADPY